MRLAPEYMQIKYSKSNFKYLSEITALILNNFVKDLPDLLTESNIQMAHAAVECFKECLTTAAALYQRKIIEFLKVSRMYSSIQIRYIVQAQNNKITQLFAFRHSRRESQWK